MLNKASPSFRPGRSDPAGRYSARRRFIRNARGQVFLPPDPHFSDLSFSLPRLWDKGGRAILIEFHQRPRKVFLPIRGHAIPSLEKKYPDRIIGSPINPSKAKKGASEAQDPNMGNKDTDFNLVRPK